MSSHYNFDKDLKIAINTEKEISEKLLSFYGWKTIATRQDNKYDLLVQKNKRIIKVECKEDFTCKRTNNVGLEFQCRGKLSGISVTDATHYIYKVHTKDKIVFKIIKTDTLKEMIMKKAFFRVVSGGDIRSSSMNYLFKYYDFCKYSRDVFTEKK